MEQVHQVSVASGKAFAAKCEADRLSQLQQQAFEAEEKIEQIAISKQIPLWLHTTLQFMS